MPLITGTSGDDSLTGTNDPDTIDLLEGNDVALGLGGDDVINGGDGADQLRGDGDPGYTGPSGNDTLNGGVGNDILWGGAGVDTFHGGDGRDRVSFYSLAATQGASANLMTQTIANDGYGNAEIMTSIESLGGGTAFADSFTGDDGSNLLFAGFGDTVIANGGNDIVFMDSAPAVLDGGAGNDTIAFAGDTNGMLIADTNGDGLAEIVLATMGVEVDLRSGFVFNDGFGNAVAISGFENIDGSELGDFIVGDDASNMLNGWGGDDAIIGFGGDDFIDGGEGNDQLRGDGTPSYLGPSGNDVIFGAGGDDIMWGGAGVDFFDGGDGVDRVSFYNRGATQGAVASLITQTISNDGYGNAETMVSVEGLGAGTAFADSFTGDDSANLLWAGLGDTVIANGGDDTIIVDSAALVLDGGDGIDTIQFQGDQTGMLTPDTSGDGLAEIVFATNGVNVNLRSNAIFDDGFGNFGTIANIENVDGSLLDDFIQGSDVDNVLNGLAGLDVIRGFGGNDTIDGGDGDDNLAGDGAFNYNGPSGDDIISGGAGDDLMRGGAGVDTFDGGEGDNDRVSFYSVWATQAVVADLNTQTISNDGYGNAETMTSVEGLGAGTVFADTFIGNDAANTLLGDTGDTVTANGGDDLIQVGGAPAIVDGGAGVDTLSLAQGVTLQADNNGDGAAEEVLATAGYTINLTTGTLADEWGGVGAVVNVENVDGTSFDDDITGDDGANVINAGEGNDIVVGLGGDDVIDGGDGADQIRGDGDPTYLGPSGDDTLSGGVGNDTLWGGAGVDSFDGGDGRDRVSFYSLAATQGAIANLVTQTISNDGYGNAETMISIESLGAGTAFADSFTGDDGSNLLFAGFGDTVIANGGNDVVIMDSAPAVLDGGAGNDTLAFAGDTNGMLIADTNGDGLAEIVLATMGVEVDLRSGFVFNDGFGNAVAISGFENIDGSELGDFIVGNDDLNMLNGWGGDDAIIGFGGDDFIDGGEGNDQLRGDGTSSYNGPSGSDIIFGAGGDDIMWGGAGTDQFDGGDGSDRVSFYNRAATQGAVASLITQTISNDGYGNAETMVSVEGLGAGTAFADSFTGDDNANLLWAGLGDTVIANGGDDTIIVDSAALVLDGGDGIDTIQFQGDQTGMLTPDTSGDGLAEIVFATNGVNVNLRSNAIFDDGFGNFGTIANIENVDGSLLDDFIQGSDVDNVLNGLAGLDVIRGFGGNDTIDGGDGDDNLAGDGAFNYNGPSGDDVISGGAGDDLMRGGAGVDTFDGGDGDNDRVSFYSLYATQGVVANLITQTITNDGYGNAETMSNVEGLGAGTAFADTFIGNDAANTLLGDFGDTVIANAGDDTIQIARTPAVVDGGAGNDTLIFSGLTLQPDSDADGAAEEVLATAGVVVDLSAGQIVDDGFGGSVAITGIENVSGSTLADTITGDGGDNALSGGADTDVLTGLGGNDTIDGGEGSDQLWGDGNQSTEAGGPAGDDVLIGGAGNDFMNGGAGVDSFDGGEGLDRVSFYNLAATQGAVASIITQTISNDGFGNVETMVGIERLGNGTAFADHFTGDDAPNLLFAGLGDTAIGNGGNDTFFVDSAPATLDGGAGIDTLTIIGGTLLPDNNGDGLAEVVFATAGVIIDLSAGMIFDDGFGNSAAISGFENVNGGEFDDQIVGDNNVNFLGGAGGDDAILGLGGDDIVFGGEGNDQLRGDGGSSGLGPFGHDQLFGEGGDDYMNGGAGVDFFDGGDGADRVSFYNRSATQGAVASLITQTISNDGFGNVETMVSVEGLGAGTAYADQLTGDDGANFMYAGFGDTILTNGGDDTIQVDSAALLLDGGVGVDTIQFVGDVNGMLVIDNTGDGLAEIALATTGVQVSLRSNAIFDDGFGNFGTILNIENVDGSLLDDFIQGSDVSNVLNGLDGADVIFGYGGGDIINGGAGDDQLRGEAGATYNGLTGDDQLSGGDGDDYMNGGAGVDTFDGGAGADRVSFFSYTATQGAVASLITQTISNDGFGNAETMLSVEGLGGGTAYADTFIGDDNANLILAEIGDTVQANGGDDTFQLSGGPALIDGGAGVDTVIAFTGDTGGALTPDTNADGLAELVFAVQGVSVDLRTNQILNDGFGNAGVILNVENVGGSTLNDTIYGDNTNGNVLSGYEGDDTLSGFGGNDTLNGGAGADTLNGGNGVDTATYADETDAMFIDLTAGTARRGSAAAPVEDTLVSIENVIGGSGDDTITGSGSVNTLSGGAGADTIVGGGAADTIRGDDGDDTIDGAAGADTIDAGVGNDTIRYTIGHGTDVTDGGAGVDTLAVSGTSGNNTLSVTFDGATFTAFSGGTLANIEVLTADLGGGIDTLAYSTSANVAVDLAAGAASGFGAIAGIENVTTGSGNDTLVGDGGANRLAGGAGDDTYYADSGDTIVEASGAGVDFVYTASSTFTLSANVENLTYTGVGSFTGAGNGLANVIVGGAAGDNLSGAGGNDTLIGGGGDDVMNGGAGNDTFVLSAGGGHDTVNGFDANPTGGQDLLDLTAYGITSADFAARVSIIDLGSDTQVIIDGIDSITLLGVNGTGSNVITQGDFILGGG